MESEGTINQETTESVEALRLILQGEQHRAIPYGEALEVSEALIAFYEVLAESEFQLT